MSEADKGTEATPLRDLGLHDRVAREHPRVWEDFEEDFAVDPYSAAIFEIGRAIYHALELGGSMSLGEQRILLGIAITAAHLDTALLNSEHFTKHFDSMSSVGYNLLLRELREVINSDNFGKRN